MVDEKKQLRQTLLALRKALPADLVNRYSKAICRNIVQFNIYQEAKNIAYYHPIHHEVSLVDIASSHKNFYVPKITNHQSMIFCQDKAPYVQNQYGILEPLHQKNLPIEKLDLMFIPMVGFDKHGHRLGMGKGYYDRFLATQPHLPILIGVAYAFQERANIPYEKHDYPMDYVMTEKTILKCR